ncbi:MAG: hypothetical protein JST59_18800 [Actinobacteria bacterium]|nr:hypothetical protein [Actinomycetota bacterium]
MSIRNFRGLEKLEFLPDEHVLLVGEPRAGRSTIIDALYRALSPNGSRGTVGHDLDLFGRDRGLRAEVEVVLGDLDEDLTQRFYDQLEFWDDDENELVEELDEPDQLEGLQPVVRVCYRLRWNAEEESAEQWVDFPKSADPENDLFERVRRRDLEALPVFFSRSAGSPLSLANESNLRRILDNETVEDFAEKLELFAEKAEALGGDLVESEQLLEALRRIVSPVSSTVGVSAENLSDELSFVPAGVALGALLRGLEPTLSLGSDAPTLPLSRHGSTVDAALTGSELLARGREPGGIVFHDDFGEGLDGPTSTHLASLLRRRVRQAWITTRRPEVAGVFKPAELARLVADADAARHLYKGKRPKTKAERMAARHLALQLLPLATARGVVVVEGPHDRAGLQALAERRLRKEGVALLAGSRIGVVDAGAVDSSGGSSALPRICAAARQLGFFTLALLDGDPDDAEIVEANLESADVVIRLPDGKAIELALLDGLEDEEIRKALKRLDVHLPTDFDQLSGSALTKAARKALKSRGGAHAEFVDALRGPNPGLGVRILDAAKEAVDSESSGCVQL